jgi:pilus assembly protein CpaB
MNPRQRRGLLLLVLSGLGLLAVFVLIASYVADVRTEVDPKIKLLALAKPVKAYQSLDDSDVTEVTMPKRWAPKTALRSKAQLIGLVAETGVAGKIGPGAVVDIVGTFQGDPDRGVKPKSTVVVPAARIIDVGQTQVQGSKQVQQADADPKEVVPVTFALTPKQQLQVTEAESFADEVRLALRRPGDLTPLKKSERTYSRPDAG